MTMANLNQDRSNFLTYNAIIFNALYGVPPEYAVKPKVKTLSERFTEEDLTGPMNTSLDMNVGCVIVPPFSYHCCVPSRTKNCKKFGQAGFAIDELSLLREMLEIKLDTNVSFNMVDFTGTGANTYQVQLQNGTVDMFQPLMPWSRDLMNQVDFAEPFLNLEPGGFQVHLVKNYFQVSIFNAFQPMVWGIWIILLMIASLIFASIKLGTKAQRDKHHPVWLKIFLRFRLLTFIWYNILNGKRSLVKGTMFRTAKVLIAFWSISSLFSSIMFKSEFFHNLSPDLRRSQPFKNIHELAKILSPVNNRYFIADRTFSPEMSNILKGNDSRWEPVRKLVRADAKIVVPAGKSVLEVVDFVSKNPGAVHFLGVYVGNYFRRKHPYLLEFEDPDSPGFKSSFVLPKNSSVTSLISNCSDAMLRYGFVTHFHRKYRLMELWPPFPQVYKWQALTLGQLWYSMLVSFLFMCVAFLVLWIEIVVGVRKENDSD